MNARKANAEALLKRAHCDFAKIEAEYARSLQRKSVSPDLKIDIKSGAFGC
jgi:hypothetical protein